MPAARAVLCCTKLCSLGRVSETAQSSFTIYKLLFHSAFKDIEKTNHACMEMHKHVECAYGKCPKALVAKIFQNTSTGVSRDLSQLKTSRDQYHSLQGEFIEYRKHTQVHGHVDVYWSLL